MRWSATVAVVLSATAALGQSHGEVLEPLVSALDDAQSHAASLADHAATAPPQSLKTPSPDETGAFAAVVAADQALNGVMEGSPGALGRRVDMAVLSDLNAAHHGLASYAQARGRGDRKAMKAAAGDATEALARAEARLDFETGHHE